MKIHLNISKAQWINDDVTLHPGDNEIEDISWDKIKNTSWILFMLEKDMVSLGVPKEIKKLPYIEGKKNSNVDISIKKVKRKV